MVSMRRSGPIASALGVSMLTVVRGNRDNSWRIGFRCSIGPSGAESSGTATLRQSFFQSLRRGLARFSQQPVYLPGAAALSSARAPLRLLDIA